MSLKRMLLASSAAIALIAPATDASAQYSDRRHCQPHATGNAHDRRPPQRRTPLAALPRQIDPRARTPVPRQRRNRPAGRKRLAPLPSRASRSCRGRAPSAPLTEEQLAAKAAVDELLAREPALAAAKERPDPALARAAAAKHDARRARLAALKAKEEAAAAKRQEIADKTKARDDAKAAALKAKQDTQLKAQGEAARARNRPAIHRTAQPAASRSNPHGMPPRRDCAAPRAGAGTASRRQPQRPDLPRSSTATK